MRWLREILALGFCAGIVALIYTSIKPFLNEPPKQDKPSASVPAFLLPDLNNPKIMVTKQDIAGKPALINVWASWCFSCRVEHDLLVHLSRQGIPVYGVDYKDDQLRSSQTLHFWSKPYNIAVSDKTGSLVHALGITDLPVTLLVDGAGKIRFQHSGALSEYVWKNILQPRYQILVKASRKRQM